MSGRRACALWGPAIVGALLCLDIVAGTSAQTTSGVVMGRPARPQTQPEGTGGIRGRVVDGADGRPLRGAMVSVSSRRPAREIPVQFSARTGADGTFAIEQLADGDYVVFLHRQGFVEPRDTPPTPRHVTVRGDTIEIGDLPLLRGGALTGRVLDDRGEPVVRARVTPIGRPHGQDLMATVGGMVQTDDRGVYRAHGLMPGRYTVRVVPIGPSARGPVRLQGQEPELLPAFAPASRDLSLAEFAVVRAGEDALLDVRLPSGRLARVAGRAINADGGESPGGITVSLRPVDPLVPLEFASVPAQADGSFEILDVAPGRYLLAAEEPTVSTPRGLIRSRAGRLEIVVGDEPVVEAVVPMGYGAVVRGRIEVEDGDVATLSDRAPRVVASAARGAMRPSRSIESATSDLAFELRDVRGHRQLAVVGLPSGWWLKSVLIDGEDACDGHEFAVAGVVDGVVLLVSARESGLTGRVARGAAAAQGASVVVMRESAVESGAALHVDNRMVGIAIDGTFTAAGLRPGRYLAVALAPRARGGFDRLGHEERLALVEARGRRVEVVEGRTAAVTLPLVER